MTFSRKGDLELRTIILLILGLLVLIVLAVIFNKQLSQFLDTLFSITKEVNSSRPPLKDLFGR